MILLYTVAEKGATEICVTDGRTDTPITIYCPLFKWGYNKEGRKELQAVLDPSPPPGRNFP